MDLVRTLPAVLDHHRLAGWKAPFHSYCRCTSSLHFFLAPCCLQLHTSPPPFIYCSCFLPFLRWVTLSGRMPTPSLLPQQVCVTHSPWYVFTYVHAYVCACERTCTYICKGIQQLNIYVCAYIHTYVREGVHVSVIIRTFYLCKYLITVVSFSVYIVNPCHCTYICVYSVPTPRTPPFLPLHCLAPLLCPLQLPETQRQWQRTWRSWRRTASTSKMCWARWRRRWGSRAPFLPWPGLSSSTTVRRTGWGRSFKGQLGVWCSGVCTYIRTYVHTYIVGVMYVCTV